MKHAIFPIRQANIMWHQLKLFPPATHQFNGNNSFRALTKCIRPARGKSMHCFRTDVSVWAKAGGSRSIGSTPISLTSAKCHLLCDENSFTGICDYHNVLKRKSSELQIVVMDHVHMFYSDLSLFPNKSGPKTLIKMPQRSKNYGLGSSIELTILKEQIFCLARHV